MFILKKGHQPGVYVPLRALFLVNKTFCTHRGQDEPMKSFYNSVTRNKMKTMSDTKTTVRCKTKDIPMNGEEMYLRLLAINAYKWVPLERLVAFENSASQFIL